MAFASSPEDVLEIPHPPVLAAIIMQLASLEPEPNCSFIESSKCCDLTVAEFPSLQGIEHLGSDLDFELEHQWPAFPEIRKQHIDDDAELEALFNEIRFSDCISPSEGTAKI